MKTMREVASQREIDLLLEEGLIEESHLGEPILGEQDATAETYYRLSDVVVVIRDQTEPTAFLLPTDWDGDDMAAYVDSDHDAS